MNILKETAVDGDEIGDKSKYEELDAGDHEDGGKDETGEVRAGLACDEEKEKEPAEHEEEPRSERDGAENREKPERFIDDKNAEDGENGTLDVGGNTAKETGGTEEGVCTNGDGDDAHIALARLDDGFQRIGVLVKDIDLESGLAADGAKPAGGVGDLGGAGETNDATAELLKEFLQRRKMLDLGNGTFADDHVGLAGDNGGDEGGDVGGVVLIIGIRIDDDVGPALQAGGEPGHEGAGEAEVGALDHVIDAAGAGDIGGAVGAAIIDDEPLDGIDAGKRAWQLLQGDGQSLFLVITRNLDDDFHVMRRAQLTKNHSPRPRIKFL